MELRAMHGAGVSNRDAADGRGAIYPGKKHKACHLKPGGEMGACFKLSASADENLTVSSGSGSRGGGRGCPGLLGEGLAERWTRMLDVDSSPSADGRISQKGFRVRQSHPR